MTERQRRLLRMAWRDPKVSAHWSVLRSLATGDAKPAQGAEEVREQVLAEIGLRLTRRKSLCRRCALGVVRLMYRWNMESMAGALFGLDITNDVDAELLMAYVTKRYGPELDQQNIRSN